MAALPSTDDRLGVLSILLARRQVYTGFGDIWLMIEANERSVNIAEENPTWISRITDGMWERLTDPTTTSTLIQQLLSDHH